MRHWYSSIHVEQLASSMRERGHTVDVAAHQVGAGRPPSRHTAASTPAAGRLETSTASPRDHSHALGNRQPPLRVLPRHGLARSAQHLDPGGSAPGDTRRLHRCRTQRTAPRAHPHHPGRQTHVAPHSMRTRIAPPRAQARRGVPALAHQGGQEKPVAIQNGCVWGLTVHRPQEPSVSLDVWPSGYIHPRFRQLLLGRTARCTVTLRPRCTSSQHRATLGFCWPRSRTNQF